MPLDALRDLIPPYAQDMARNMSVLLDETTLSDQQKWGTLLACAHAIGHADTLRLIAGEAQQILSPEAVTAAKTASALMGMNNIYYRALHLMHNREYEGLRSGLRMGALMTPGVDKVDFELWCFAVSAVNGCGLCMDSHEKVLRDHGATALQVQASLRIAATINAISAVLRAEDALSHP